ncbi:Thioredoxin [Orchesella cincta]|uniref:Thioredoxin n=1 Tax=Orchesella cincta TaxID=48709 RepID=A0A1D2MJP2_ORCCI|nr:Thioredoxin [Orchesella cincta]
MNNLTVFSLLALAVAVGSIPTEAQGQGPPQAPAQGQAQGTKNIIDVYSESVFNYAVLNNRKPVVVFFGSDNCGACKWMYPQLERLVKNRADKMYLAKVDTEKLDVLAADYGVTASPTIMTLFYGEIVEIVEGAQWSKVVALVNNASKL